MFCFSCTVVMASNQAVQCKPFPQEHVWKDIQEQQSHKFEVLATEAVKEVLHREQSWSLYAVRSVALSANWTMVQLPLPGKATLVRPTMIVEDLNCPPPNARIIHPSDNLWRTNFKVIFTLLIRLWLFKIGVIKSDITKIISGICHYEQYCGLWLLWHIFHVQLHF